MSELINATAVIVPIFNEELRIQGVINDLKKNFQNIIVVNDASEDKSKFIVEDNKVICIDFETNMGQGYALNAGFSFAKLNSNIRYIVTFDGDGQHSSDDALEMLKLLEIKKLDCILASRFLSNKTKIPFLRKSILRISTILNNFFSAYKFTDNHNGLRVINLDSFRDFKFFSSRMAHASEINNYIVKNNLSYVEYDCQIRYNLDTRKKSQNILNSINIIFEIFLRRFFND